MRRKDMELTDTFQIEEIIRQASVCHLAMADDDGPYIVSMNFGYSTGSLYFHSAPEGRKIDILRRSPRVSFSIVAEAEIISAESACGWTCRYRSVTGFGKATILKDDVDKRGALSILMAQYSDSRYDFQEADLDGVVVIRVAVKEMVGKVSG